MMPLLATEVDLVTLFTVVGSALAAFLTFITTLGGGVWLAGTKICNFLWDKLSPTIAKHDTMITRINEEIPKVSAAIEGQKLVIGELAQTTNALKDTQIQQFKRFDEQDARLDQHGEKIDLILVHITNSDPNQKVKP